MGKTKIFSDEEEKIIIYNYVELGKGLKETGAAMGYNYTTIQKVLKQKNIPIKPADGRSTQKYFINKDFFFNQSQNLAYVIGLLGSDGTVDKNRNLIAIELQRIDKKILENINIIIGNDRPVKDYITNRGYENSKIYFYSKEIKDELATYHIVPNKTYNPAYKFPEKIKKEFYPDYIRGLFDGDGSIKATSDIYRYPRWQIDSSSRQVLEKIQEYLLEFNIKTTIQEQQKVNIILYRLLCSNVEGCKKIYNLLYYPEVELFLERKYNRFTELLS